MGFVNVWDNFEYIFLCRLDIAANTVLHGDNLPTGSILIPVATTAVIICLVELMVIIILMCLRLKSRLQRKQYTAPLPENLSECNQPQLSLEPHDMAMQENSAYASFSVSYLK